MGTEVAKAQSTDIAVSSGLAAAFGAVESNINLGEQTPHLSIKGKVWKIVIEGNEKALMKKDEDGEVVPMSLVEVLILNQVPKRSRVYFKDDYVEGTNVQPTCWSVNGDTPSVDVATPLARTCKGCEMAIKGSKITPDGKQTTACSQNKRVCVIPSNSPDFTALLLKLPVTSLWEQEGSEQAQGWYAFDAYLKFLKGNGVEHTAMVATKMKFDSKDISYPKVLFKYAGLISDEMGAKVAPRVASDEVLHVLGLDEALPDLSQVESKPAAEEAAVKEEVVAKEEVSTVDDSDAFGGSEPVVKKAPPKKKTAKKKAKAKKEAVVEEADSDDELADIMSDWGE